MAMVGVAVSVSVIGDRRASDADARCSIDETVFTISRQIFLAGRSFPAFLPANACSPTLPAISFLAGSLQPAGRRENEQDACMVSGEAGGVDVGW